MADSELSLHFTLTQDDLHADIEHKSDEDEEEPEYFDPFAIENNAEKPSTKQDDNLDKTEVVEVEHKEEMTIDQNESNDTKDGDDKNDDPMDTKEEQMSIDDMDEDIDDDINDIENDIEDEVEDMDEDEDEEEEDDDLRKELEESWAKQEKEKNQNMIHLLQVIRNKHKSPPKQQPQKKIDVVVPKINPFVFDGNLKITLPSKSKSDDADKRKFHFHPTNTYNKRRKMKNELKHKLSKKRKHEMRRHRKEFGKEQDYYHDHQDGNKLSVDIEDEEDEVETDIDIDIEDNDNEEEQAKQDEIEDDIEELDANKYIAEIVEDGDDLDEEDLARAALMTKPQILSSAARELLDIAADEEDENGEVRRAADLYQDEHEEKFGIAKNLLAEKSEIKFLKQHKAIYDEKRNQIHQQLVNQEDDKQFDLIKRAFIDGEYKSMQNKRRKRDVELLGGSNDNDDGKHALNFKSRHFELDCKNEPEYYLSDNEEKNEFCCYDENGLFYEINTIRMKIMEWNKIHKKDEDKDNILLQLDDEEDKEAILLRQKRVEKRETVSNLSGNGNNLHADHHKIGDDKNAVKILEKLRNKKTRKKPKLKKSHTMDTNFNAFYMKKGLEIPSLQRSNSSFLQHRDKCIEINKIAQNKSRSILPSSSSMSAAASSSRNGIGRKKAIIFQNKSEMMRNTKKRRRVETNQDENNVYKKRRI